MKQKRKTGRLRAKGKTAPGTHVPIMVDEVIACLEPRPGGIVVDCTLGYGGHAAKFIKRIAPDGQLIGLDVDEVELEKTRRRLSSSKVALTTQRANFAQIKEVLAAEQIDGVNIIFADIGVSSMQVDDASRGIHYKADGPLDMRMDNRLEKTGADLLAEMSQEELSRALWELSDEPDHEIIAQYIVGQRISNPITTVSQLVRLVFNAKGLTEKTWKKQQKHTFFGSLHPAARTFQAIRILVNDELNSLKKLLEDVPDCLKSGGKIGIISFHNGEDRLVKSYFRDGLKTGVYSNISKDAVTPRTKEIVANPRSSSARFRWAQKA